MEKISKYKKYKKSYKAYNKIHGKYYHDKYYFGGLRTQILKRDKYKCVKCGMSRKQHKKLYKRDLSVDHIDGNGVNSVIKNNTMSNLQTLCYRCHGKKDIERSPNTRRRPINQFNINGIFLGSFNSIMDAERTLGINNASIVNVLKGRQITAYNYKFQYRSET